MSPENFNAPSHAWAVTSFADLEEFAGLGGGMWHFRFRNVTTRLEQDYVLVAGGLGLAAEVPVAWLTSIGRIAVAAFDNVISRGANFAAASYSRSVVRGRVSFADLVGARGAISCAQAGVGIAGGSAFGLNVMVPALGPGPRLETDLSGFSFTLGAGVFAATGCLVPVGMGAAEAMTRTTVARERRRRPTDPVVRDPGHY